MATQPTKIDVPSESPRDLKFNAGKIDDFVTSLALQYADRFGGKHYTIEGLRWLIEQAISKMGWVLINSFQDGAEITLPNQALRDENTGEYYRWDGSFPKTVPADSSPESTGGIGVGAWIGVGDASLRALLASEGGSSAIGMANGGTLEQIIHYVTPEQFGAIGDGKIHALSTIFMTLSDAKKKYPHVTSLEQTIDWAACQAADLYARGKCAVRCPHFAKYNFDQDYLELGINSIWRGSDNPQRDSGGTRMIRELTKKERKFGQDCVVRVMDANKSESADEFIRGIVFEGIFCMFNLPRRPVSKYTGRIAFHANFGLGMRLGIGAAGAEYGVFGYSYWGSSGWITVDSCHIGIYSDSATATPEYKNPERGTVNTTINFRIKIDACVYGVVFRRVKYSNLHGYIEGMLAKKDIFANYDYENETAIAVTLIDCDSVDLTQLGIEAWEGVHVYASNSTATINESWTQDAYLLNTTGKHGPYHAMATLNGNTELFKLPQTNNSYFYAMKGAILKLRNMTGDMSDTNIFGSTFLITTDKDSRFCLDNCAIYFGSSRLIHPVNGYWSNISFVNDRFFGNYFLPNSSYTYLSNGECVTTDWATKGVNAGDGRVVFDAPAGFKIIDYTAGVYVSTLSQVRNYAPMGVFSATDNRIVLQTGVDVEGFAITYKLRLKIIK